MPPRYSYFPARANICTRLPLTSVTKSVPLELTAIRCGNSSDCGSPQLAVILPSEVEMKDLVDVAFGGEELVADDQQAERIAEAAPVGQMLALGIEDLHALVAAVGDVNAVLLVDRQAVGGGELAGFFPLLAPFQQVAAVGSELDDAAVAAVGDVDVALRIEDQIVRRAKAFLAARRLAFGAKRRQQPAFAIELAQHVVAVVGRPDVVFAIDAQAVGTLNSPCPQPRTNLPFGVERHQRRLAAVQDIDAVLGIDRDGRHRADFDFGWERQEAGGDVGIGGENRATRGKAASDRRPRRFRTTIELSQ